MADLAGWDTRHYLTLLRQQAEKLRAHPGLRHLRFTPADLAAQTLERATDARTRPCTATAERDRLAWFLRIERDLLTELQQAYERQAGTWTGKPAASTMQVIGQALLDSTGVWDTVLDAQKEPTKAHTPTPAAEAAAGPPPAPTVEPFDKYTDFELLSQGGMGEVYKCRDMELGRSVAMKLMHAHLATDPDLVRHFNEEAQVAGQLQHPSVAIVHERGRTPDQRPYFTMKLIRGKTLAQAIADYHAKPTAKAREQLLHQFVVVAETVAYAHQKNVLHRDLKPLNIMVGAFDEVQVMDWGLSKVLDHGDDHRSNVRTVRTNRPDAETRAGVVRGTFAYMSPEQASADRQALDHRTDIFALGAILCEILTGKPLYVPRPDAPNRQEELWRMAHTGHTGPAFDRLDASGAPAPLVQLAKKCLEFRPEDRPASATDLATTIKQYFAAVAADERSSEIQSATHGAHRKARRWQYALGGAIALSIVLGLGTFLWLDFVAKARLRTAKQALETATAEVLRLQAEAERLPDATPDEARRAAEAWGKCLAVVEQAQNLTNAEALPAAEKEQLAALTETIRARTTQATAKVAIAEKNEKLLRDMAAAELRAGNRLLEYRSDYEAARKAYRQAFKDYGVDVLDIPPEESAATLKAMHASGLDALIRGLDFWNFIGKDHKDRPRQTADLLDSNAWRREFRAALITKDIKQLKALAADDAKIDQAIAANEVDLLGAVLRDAKEVPHALRLFEYVTQKRSFSSYAMYMEYGICLATDKRPKYGEAATQFLLATEKNKQSSPAFCNLGLALMNSRTSNAANAQRAESAYRRALELQPDNVVAHTNLATYYLTVQNDPARADAALQEALRYRADFKEAKAVLALCRVLQFRMKEADELLAELPSENREGLMGLTVQLVKALAGLNEAEAARVALKLATNHPHHEIGALCAILHPLLSGDSVTAAAEAKLFVEDYENVPFWKGFALVTWALAEMYQGHLKEAEDRARAAVKLDPNSAHTHQALFQVLVRQGRFRDAESVSQRINDLTKGATIFSKMDDVRKFAFDRGVMRIDAQVDKLAMGEGKPDPNFIQLQAECALLKGHVQLARELYAKFTSPKDEGNASEVLEQMWSALQGYEGVTHRTNAARAVLRLAQTDLPEAERQALRRDALAYLQADLAFKTRWSPVLAKIPKLNLFTSVERYRRWLLYVQHGDDFASVRGEALKKLPEAEQAAWSDFWAEAQKAFERGLSSAKKK